MFLHLDCRHYKGDRPCRYQRLCEGCPHYQPMGKRVLIIKLGALGDVVRTAALLPGLARLTGEVPHVSWITAPAAVPLVQRMPGVDRVIPFVAESLLPLEHEKFDYILSLDKEPEPCAIAMRVSAEMKLGVGVSRYGTPFPLNEEADYYFRLGLDNPEKFFGNQKSLPHLLYDAINVEYQGERYTLEPTAADLQAAAQIYHAAGVSEGVEVIGLNPGAGKVYAHKAWRAEGYVELIAQLQAERPQAHLVLIGGADEASLIDRINYEARAKTPAARDRLHTLGTQHPLGTFMALVRRVSVLVSGDTLAMHLAIAQQRPAVAIFGPTCQQEIDMYGRGEKLVSMIGCAPCYRRACDLDPHCMDMITHEEVAAAVLRQLEPQAEIVQIHA